MCIIPHMEAQPMGHVQKFATIALDGCKMKYPTLYGYGVLFILKWWIKNV